MQHIVQARKKGMHLRHYCSVPFIWLPLVFVFMLDVALEIYHRICFPLYGIECIQRKKHIRIDRHRLSYLGLFQKINCMYCGYVNGFIAYAQEVAGRTELYWCAIKHEKSSDYVEPSHHKKFLKYGDQKAYKKLIKK